MPCKYKIKSIFVHNYNPLQVLNIGCGEIFAFIYVVVLHRPLLSKLLASAQVL